MFIHNKLCTGLVLAFGGLAMAANSVMAQQVDKLQRVEVTGSNIPRAGPWTLATTTNYVGSFDVTDPASGYLNCQAGIQGFNVQFANGNQAPDKYCTVGAFTSTNLSVKYQYSKGLTLRGAVVNLFGAESPVDLAMYGGTPSSTVPSKKICTSPMKSIA